MDIVTERSKSPGIFYVDVFPYRLRSGIAEYLLLRRRSDVVLGDSWQQISGKILPAERIAHAFSRQIEAKTRLRPTSLWKVPHVSTFYDDHYDTVMFVPAAACELDGEISLDPSLHTEHRWARYDSALAMLLWPGPREALRLVHEVASGQRVLHELERIESATG